MDLMSIRRGLMSRAKKSILPKECQQVLWIKASDGAYVDTGYVPTKNTTVLLDYELSSNMSGMKTLFGLSSGANLRAEIRYGSRWNCYANGYMWNNPTSMHGIGNKAGTRFNMSLNGNVFKINEHEVTGPPAWNATSLSAFLFAGNDNGAPSQNISDMMLYSFKLFESGEKSLDLVPCYRKSDDEIGLYDIVRSVFLTNAGTGTFLKGADV